jgi:HSP20 family protein
VSGWILSKSGLSISGIWRISIMLIRRIYPIRENASFENRVSSFFQDFVASVNPEAAGNFVPATDIYEEGDTVRIQLDIPGVKQEDVDIRVENQTLTVRAERKNEGETKQENFHRNERHNGSFYRSFTLPTSVDTENIAASYEAGVLKLELKKKASAQPRQIKIGAAA